MAESNFQAKVIRWLKQKGCYVIKLQAGPGVPVGAPDVLALIDGGGWIALECKASNPFKKDGTAKAGAFQPLQLATIAKLDEMFYSRVVYDNNWEEVKRELENII